MLLVYKVNKLQKGARGNWIWQESCFARGGSIPAAQLYFWGLWRRPSRKTEVCRHSQRRLNFTKPQKLGHLRVCLEITLHYLSKDFFPPSSSSSSLPSLSSFSVIRLLLFYLPPPHPPMCPQCCSGEGGRGDEGREVGCCSRALSSSLCGAVASGRRHREWLHWYSRTRTLLLYATDVFCII